MTTRAIRNNNPLNIRLSTFTWLGQINGPDKEFCTFATMDMGIRAALINLRTHLSRDTQTTIRKEITRWAPPSENATERYISQVCSLIGHPDSTLLRWSDGNLICRLLAAMAKIESGQEFSLYQFKRIYENL